MPPLPRLLEYTDYALLISGALFGLVVVARLAMSRRMGEALRLPPTAAASGLDFLDVFAALVAMIILPHAINLFFDAVNPPVVSTDAALEVPSSGESVASSLPALQEPRVTKLPTLQQTVAMTLGQCVTVLIFIIVIRRRVPGGLAAWGIDLRRLPRDLWRGTVAFFAVWPWCSALFYVSVMALVWIWPDYPLTEHQSIRLLMDSGVPSLLRILTFFNALVMAAVVEEAFFRGMFQPLMLRASGRPWTAVILTGVAFGVFHYPLYQTFAPLALLGVALGYAYARTGSLLLPICLHMVFNAKTLIWLALGAGAEGSP